MRLLHSDLSREAAPILEEFYDSIPPYAILSHRWCKAAEEVSFKDIEIGVDISKKEGFKKLQYCCQQARKEGYEYVWIDTCCIDKSSSAELSEAINSMYNWYMNSEVCYAYLSDVSCPSWNLKSTETIKALDAEDSFRKSAWFTRGWTLQELIGPNKVKFFDQNWWFIGTKHDLANLVSEITRIDPEVLTNQRTPASVAQRMSWAAGRKTTRVEDRAYSLMGIFGVNMPPLYGEGPKAFMRLQEEIMRQSFDHSLFSWTPRRSGCGLLAESPDHFLNCSNIIPISYDKYILQVKAALGNPDYSQTNFGTRINLPLERTSVYAVYRAYLACTRLNLIQTDPGQHNALVHIDLLKEPGAGLDTYSRYFEREYGKIPSCLIPARVQAESIYISCTREGNFEQTPSPKLQIDLRVVHTNFDTPFICYYYGGKVIESAVIAGAAYIDIGLEWNENSAVTILAGNFCHPGEDILNSKETNVYASFGIYNGVFWTDIYEQGGRDPYETLKQLYEKYMRQEELAAILCISLTKKRWEGWLAGAANDQRYRFDGVIEITDNLSSDSTYQVTVSFSATKVQSMEIGDCKEN